MACGHRGWKRQPDGGASSAGGCPGMLTRLALSSIRGRDWIRCFVYGCSVRLALAGESGSGKTTLARMILGLTAPSSGRILFKGRDVTLLSGSERRSWFRREVQPVFQDPYATFNPLRAVDAYLGATARNFRVAARAEREARIDDALNAVGMGLRDVRGRYPNELSGGQLQRVSIARALITRPSLLVADEPVSMLDASLRMSIVNLFRALKERQSVVYITHDLATAYYAADR